MLVVAIVAVFVIAQSGGGGGGPLNAIAKAAEVTQREPGGRAVITAKVTALESSEGIAESGTMTFDDSDRARGELTVSGLTDGKEVKLVSISQGTDTYVTSDALEGKLPEGKKWMELDLAAAVKGAGTPGPASGGPKEGLKILERVQGSEEVGTEEIEGVQTTHYRGTLPTAKEVFGVKVSYSADDINVWIDNQDRVRRISLDVTGSAADEVFDATSEIESAVRSGAEGG